MNSCDCALTIGRQYNSIFSSDEHNTIDQSLAVMRNDVRLEYERITEQSHHGRPTILETVRTGNPGRPSIQIDPDFLRWAYTMRTTSGIARFLGVARSTVRSALLEHGIADPQEQPYNFRIEIEADPEDPLDPQGSVDGTATDGPSIQSEYTSSYTRPVSDISDDDLDNLVLRLKTHYRRAGISLMQGMLLRLGHRLSRERVRRALINIDPVNRVFQRIRISRRRYNVPGPMYLWHHDGQHGELLSMTTFSTSTLPRSH